jgi:hypothetical protein
MCKSLSIVQNWLCWPIQAKTEWLADVTLSMVRWEGVGKFGAMRWLRRIFRGIDSGSKEDKEAAEKLRDGSPEWLRNQVLPIMRAPGKV